MRPDRFRGDVQYAPDRYGRPAEAEVREYLALARSQQALAWCAGRHPGAVSRDEPRLSTGREMDSGEQVSPGGRPRQTRCPSREQQGPTQDRWVPRENQNPLHRPAGFQTCQQAIVDRLTQDHDLRLLSRDGGLERGVLQIAGQDADLAIL